MPHSEATNLNSILEHIQRPHSEAAQFQTPNSWAPHSEAGSCSEEEQIQTPNSGARQGLKHPKGQSYCLGRQQLKWNQVNQEAHLVEDSQSRLREPPGAVGRYSRSSYQDDNGRMQGGKSTAICMAEYEIVNKVAGGLYLVM
jgi:hypothetical protein